MRARWASWIGLGDPWRRPLPQRWWRQDLVVALLFAVLGVAALELARSSLILVAADSHTGWQFIAILLTAVLMIWRRRYPLTVLVVAAAAMFVTGVTMPEVMSQLVMQVLYLLAFFTGAAWGSPRLRMVLTYVAMTLFMLGWVVWQQVTDDDVRAALDSAETRYGQQGLLSPTVGAMGYALLVNVIFFGGIFLVGVLAWRSARQQALVQEQGRTIAAQGQALSDRAVLDERLRIARELHDVVAHHVAVMGIQAGAARKSLDARPDLAAEAMHNVEDSAREAVAQMRTLLGTLRSQDDPTTREPEPQLADLETLFARAEDNGLTVRTSAALARTTGAEDDVVLDAVPAPVQSSVYRIVQESLTNVLRHSTARQASVAIRVVEQVQVPYVEAEVVDDGKPRTGTGGSGLGQIGIRERVATHGGEHEIGARSDGGYRVRVRIPLRPQETQSGPDRQESRP
ncbi:sensor histidine kinase [Dermacoccaceae bacterium W4C1]